MENMEPNINKRPRKNKAGEKMTDDDKNDRKNEILKKTVQKLIVIYKTVVMKVLYLIQQ